MHHSSPLRAFARCLRHDHFADLADDEAERWAIATGTELTTEERRSLRDGLGSFLDGLADPASRSNAADAHGWPPRLLGAGGAVRAAWRLRRQAVLAFADRHVQSPEALVALCQAIATHVDALIDDAEAASALLKRTSESVMAVDAEGMVTFANPASHALLGVAEGELVGRAVERVLRDAAPIAHRPGPSALVRSTLAEGTSHQGLGALLIRHDGETVHAELVIDPLGEGGPPAGAVIVLRDQARRRAVEWRLLSVASHELRTPLTSLCGALGVLTSTLEDELPAPKARILAIAQRSVDRLVRHVDRILEVNRLESGLPIASPRYSEADALIRDALEALESQREARGVTVRLDGAAGRLWADERLAVRALVLLLGYALETAAPNSELVVRAERSGAAMAFSIRNQGHGVHPEGLRSCLDAPRPIAIGEVLKAGLDHLDLVLCREVVEHQGGRLWIDLAPDEGAVFQLSLPLAPELPEPSPMVLVAEWDADVEPVIRALLERRGYRVRSVPASELAEAAAADPPALCFMTEGQAAAHLGALRAHPLTSALPVVLIGAEPRPAIADDRVVARLDKPFTPVSLLRALELARTVPPLDAALPVGEDRPV